MSRRRGCPPVPVPLVLPAEPPVQGNSDLMDHRRLDTAHLSCYTYVNFRS